MSFQVFDEVRIRLTQQTWTGAPATAQSILIGAYNGSRIDALTASNEDTIVHNLELAIYDPESAYTTIFATVAIPAGAGYTAPTFDVLAAIAVIALPALILTYLGELQGRVLEATSGTEIIATHAFGGDF